MKTWRHTQNRKYIMYRTPSEEDLDTATGNMYRQCGEV